MRAQAGMPEGIGMYESWEFSDTECGSILQFSAEPAFGYFTILLTYPWSRISGSGGCRLAKEHLSGSLCFLKTAL